MRVISLPMSPVPSRWMMPAMPHMSFASLAAGAARPAPRRPRWVLRKDVQVLAQVPVGDRGAVALPLVGLVMTEDPVHLARHRVLDHLVLLQRRQRLAQRHRDLLDCLAARDRVVDVAVLRWPGVEAALYAIGH